MDHLKLLSLQSEHNSDGIGYEGLGDGRGAGEESMDSDGRDEHGSELVADYLRLIDEDLQGVVSKLRFALQTAYIQLAKSEEARRALYEENVLLKQELTLHSNLQPNATRFDPQPQSIKPALNPAYMVSPPAATADIGSTKTTKKHHHHSAPKTRVSLAAANQSRWGDAIAQDSCGVAEVLSSSSVSSGQETAIFSHISSRDGKPHESQNHPSEANIAQHSNINPSEVGWQFVPQYYRFVNKEPHRLRCFYTKESTLIHGTEGEQDKPCFGQQEIHNKITAIGFQECRVFIQSVDAQSSANGGIIIQVIGKMSNHNEPWRKFVQTFFLAEQPNGYFVLNDIFRYLKEETFESDDASKSAGADTASTEWSQPQQPSATQTTTAAPEPTPAPSPQPTQPPAPKTWASLVASNKGKWRRADAVNRRGGAPQDGQRQWDM